MTAPCYDVGGPMLIDVGGHRLHLEVFGQGAPAVVFDAGLSDAAERWGTVPAQVADFARVVVYDRAGLGRSEAGPLPRTSGRIVAELRRALARAGVAPPYALVGHSFGGQNMQLYARRHPEDVVGQVRVGRVDQDLARRFATILTPLEWAHFLAGQERNHEGVDLAASAAEMAPVAPPPAVPLIVLAGGIVGINTYWALRNTHWALSILIGPGALSGVNPVGEAQYVSTA